jgi:hypothetical protein
MKILSIKLHGVDHILKYPIFIIEGSIYLRGKQAYVFSNEEFGLLACHTNVECCEESIKELLTLIINSYLFEPDYVVSKNAMELRNQIARYMYG